jgi:hypothetical protein
VPYDHLFLPWDGPLEIMGLKMYARVRDAARGPLRGRSLSTAL